MPNLIDAFINSIIVPNSKSDRTNDPFTEDEILAIFPEACVGGGHRVKGDEPMETDDQRTKTNFTAQILMVYYVLQYQDVLENNQKNTGIKYCVTYETMLICSLFSIDQWVNCCRF